jgi:TolB-like protein/Flp pilus assembly protein TadD
MPVHRHLHAKRGSVYALSDELDAWMASRRLRPDEGEAMPEAEMSAAAEMSAVESGVTPVVASKARLWWVLAGVACAGLVLAAWLGFRHRATVMVQPKIHSLAVLPLRNLSGDPGQDYVADGMTEALIGRLANIRDLRVISHTSVMRFKNPQLSVPEIARTLGVDAIVEGSVTKEGERIRVTAQLIRGATDTHLWSETYDREMRDALTLQSQLAQTIAKKVEVTVTGEEHQRLAAARPVAPEVYESYLKGMYLLGRGNGKVELQQSVSDFEDAIHQDATFAPAYLGMAQANIWLGTVFAGAPPAETRPKVVSFARQALALDPDLAQAHIVLGTVLQEQWQWAEAEAEFKRALQLNPNGAEAHAGYAFWLSCEGRTNEAVDWMEGARALDPMAITGAKVGMILFHAHRYEEETRLLQSALALQPDDATTLMMLGFALLAHNQDAEAIPVLEKAIALSKGSPAATGILIRAYAHTGRRQDALRLLGELKARKNAGYVPTGAFVNAYLGLGDKEQAFYWLEQAYLEKSNILQFMKTHPFFDPIRSDPRFADLMRRVGLG